MPELYPFQHDCVQTIEQWKGRCLLALEMGCGKTAVSLHWAESQRDIKPVTIVCPASLKLNWGREIKKWFPGRTFQILEGTPTLACLLETRELAIVEKGNAISVEDFSKPYDYIILNYDILHSYVDVLSQTRSDLLILDESHYIKSRKARRTKATLALSKNFNHILALSGTPVINKPIEFFNVLAMLRPDMYPSWKRYVDRYCDPKLKRKGWRKSFYIDYSGASNLDELHLRATRHVMIRKLKSEVQKDLPDKIRTVIPMPMSDKNEYIEVLNKPILNPMSYFSELKRAAVRAKLAAVKEWIVDVIEDNKLVAFCHHHEIVDSLMDKFGKRAVKLTGKETLQQRQDAIDAFQTDERIKLFVGNLQAAGIGINLTAANYVVFVELGWSPSAHDQAEDRLHRIGQENTVHAYYLIAENTVEEDIIQLIDRKREIVTQVLDGKLPESDSILTELVKLYTQRSEV